MFPKMETQTETIRRQQVVRAEEEAEKALTVQNAALYVPTWTRSCLSRVSSNAKSVITFSSSWAKSERKATA